MTPARELTGAWWPGPLPVDRLARTAVDAAVEATTRVVAARGQRRRVATSPELIAAAFAAIENMSIDGVQPPIWAPLSGFFATADGWVRLHANYPHHAAAVVGVLGHDTRAGIETALRGLRAEEVEEEVRAAGGVAVAVRTPGEWDRHTHALATRGEPWVTVERGAERRVLRGGARPLDGVRVLDLTRVIAGPVCSQLLACLGADVLRLDPPGRPELIEHYLSNGMGKSSAALDLRSASSTLEPLLAQADVALLGYRPGSLARFGLDPIELVRRYPGLVIGSLSAWGERGPWRSRPGFDSIVQAACGIAMVCGDGERPGALPVQALDHATGYLLAAHVLTLLAEARAGITRISLLGAARTLLGYPEPGPMPLASLHTPAVELTTPYGLVRVASPPMLLDGAVLRAPIGAYAASPASWSA